MKRKLNSSIKEKILIKNIKVVLLLLDILLNKCTIIRLYRELGNTYMTTAHKGLAYLWLITLVLCIFIFFMDIKFINTKDENNNNNENVGEE